MAAVRRRRQRITLENRERLVRAFNDPQQDYLNIAETLGIHPSTARGIVRRYLEHDRIEELPRGGRNNTKVDREMTLCIEAIINENPMSTLESINEQLRERLPDKPHIHSRTVAKVLDGMLYTRKLARRCPAERNRPDVLERRREYAAWFLEEAVENQVLFVDECGFNIWTSRSHGRARRGDRAYRQVFGQKGPNITITLAVSPIFGLLHHSIAVGGMNHDRFAQFLHDCAANLNEEVTHIIYDGAPAHRNAEPPADHINLRMLPPYSPFLNIVEQAISTLKAAIKNDIARPQIQREMQNRRRAREENIPLGEYRKRVLHAAAERNLGSITVAKSAAWYRHMQTYLPRCMNGEVILG